MQPVSLKNILCEQTIIRTSEFKSERSVRQLLSQLRKEGVIFIPSKLGKGVYIRVDQASKEEIDQYAHAQAKHFRTQYFNTMLPMKKFVDDQKLIELFGRFEGVMDDDSWNE